MSSEGQFQLRLAEQARQRAEAERQRRVGRQRLAGLMAELARPLPPAEEQFLGTARAELRLAIEALARAVEAAPVEAQAGLDEAGARWAQAVATAKARHRRWDARRQACEARVLAAQERVDGAAETLAGVDPRHRADAEAHLARGRIAAEQADAGATDAAIAALDACLGAASAAAQAEAEPREAVRAFLEILADMGFQVPGPRRLRDGDDRVVVEGRMPSGRQARFEVHLGGRVEFDLDGYVGDACKDDFDAVEAALMERFGAQLGPPQFVWKNPDRIKKGAKDQPGGAPSRTVGGGR